MQDIYVVLYKDYTALDAFGPVEVLGSIADFKLHFVSLDGGIVMNQQSIRLETEPMTTI